MISELKRRYHELHDLSSWRDWLIDVLSVIYVFAFPVSMLLLLPKYFEKSYYGIIAVDAFFWLLMVARIFFPRLGYRIRIAVWVITIYTLTITFFVVLGPGYARPVWMITCVAIIAIFIGTQQAVISVFVNAFLLMAAYFLLGPSYSSWRFIYEDGLLNWSSFVLNSSMLSLVVALPVGLLISRLSISLEKERQGRLEFQAAMEELEATNEEFEAQNEELIRSEDEISRKESFIRRIMENAPAAVFRLSLDSLRLEYANKRMQPIIGYMLQEAESVREIIAAIIPGEWRLKLRNFWMSFLQGEGSSFIRFPVIHKSGTRKWVDMRLVIVRDGDEKPAAVEGFIIDVTDQIEAGEALKASEEQYRNLIENITEAVFTVDSGGDITYVSPGIKRFGDYDPVSITGKNFFDFVYPDDREGLLRRFGELARGIEEPYDYRIVSPSGSVRWVQSYSRSIIKNGEFMGANGIITDIHDRRMAEDSIRKSQATLESFVDALPDPAFLVDEERRFLVVNNALALNLGLEKKEILGRKAVDIFSAGLIERSFRHVETCFDDGNSTVFEDSIKGRNYVIYVHPVLNETERVIRVAVFALDITARKNAEADRERTQMHLIQAQKMEAVGTLAGGIAHDFNNMLGGIMGSVNMIELLLSEEEGIQKEAVLKYVEMAMESSRRAAEMIKQLLALSRKSELKLAPVDINLSIKHVMNLCKNSLPKSVEIDFSTGAEPVKVLADPVQIEQVLLNLCVNASHAMTIMRKENERQGGILRVDAAEVYCDSDFLSCHADAAPGTAYARIRVSDTGIGMNEEVRHNIFDPFFTTKETGDGTGLGLAIAYGIVQQHRGFIDVASEQGRGSTFSVYLPVYYGESGGSRQFIVRESVVPGRGTILVIDDEEALLKISRGMLELCGYSVITSNNGKDGIELFTANRDGISAVLLDFSLVGTSGLDVYQGLKAIDPSVKVILTSGLADDDTLQKARNLGIMGFIPKPYSARDLSLKIKEVLGQGGW